ncbi:MAG: TonB family protein [Rhizobacter sp.]|nr:TonB family protein [Chlorobiales bacterium]
MKTLMLVFAFSLLIQTTVCAAQGRLVGRVMDENSNSVSAAIVSLQSGTKEFASISNPDGYYTFFGVPEGVYTVKAYKRGLPAFSASIKIVVNLSYQLNIALRSESMPVLAAADTPLRPKLSKSKPVVLKERKTRADSTRDDKSADDDFPQSLQLTTTKPDLLDEALQRVIDQAEAIERRAKMSKKAEFVGGAEKIYEKLSYPEEARVKRIEGIVTAKLLVSDGGKVIKIEILSSPSPYLSQEVFRVLNEDVQFIPVQENGLAVSSVVKIGIQFKLDE